MKTVEVTTSKEMIKGQPESVVSVSCPLEVPESLAEATQMWTEPVAVSHLNSSVVIWFQGRVRAMIAKKIPEAQIKAQMKGAKPGIAAVRTVDPIQSALNKFATMTPAQQAEFIQQLKQAAKK